MVDVRLPPLRALGVLLQALREQHADCRLAEVDDGVLAVAGLRRAEEQILVHVAAVRAGLVLAVELDLRQLLTDGDVPGLEVDVLPPEAERLASSKAG